MNEIGPTSKEFYVFLYPEKYDKIIAGKQYRRVKIRGTQEK